MTTQVSTDQRGTRQYQRKIYATIKGIDYPVELLSTRKENGFTIVRVKVLPRADGFTPRPFVRCTWSAPFVMDSEGEVLQDSIKVVYQ